MEFIYEENQIVLYNEAGKIVAKVIFPAVDEDTVNINHTFVDDSLRGQGVAGKLMEAAAEHLKAQNKKVVLTCSYAVKWFAKHPEYDFVTKNV